MSVPAAAPDNSHPHVEIRNDVHGGRPVLRGTRFPVSSIVQYYRQGLSVEEILEQHPQLNPAQVHDALSYYYDHRSEIDHELRETRDEERWMRRYPPTLRPGSR